jgi:hypothetical protein
VRTLIGLSGRLGRKLAVAAQVVAIVSGLGVAMVTLPRLSGPQRAHSAVPSVAPITVAAAHRSSTRVTAAGVPSRTGVNRPVVAPGDDQEAINWLDLEREHLGESAIIRGTSPRSPEVVLTIIETEDNRDALDLLDVQREHLGESAAVRVRQPS